MLSISGVNDRNRQFWAQRAQMEEEWMKDDAVTLVAWASISREINDPRLPMSYRRSFGQALEDATHAKAPFQDSYRASFSRMGGSASKGDALNHLIQEILVTDPEITEKQLIRKLKNSDSPIEVRIYEEYEVKAGDEPMIHWKAGDKTLKTAPLSGLKSRLSRAKDKNGKKNSCANRQLRKSATTISSSGGIPSRLTFIFKERS